jgi:DNA-directed RNA polymerase subunit beta'
MSFNKDNKVNNGYSSISIGLASPEEILAQSSGEVLKPETINYRTYKPERDGLFCERIFGPVKDYECHCGKYKRIRYKGIVCDRCGVEVTEKKVRRERMGHISLVVPVVHIWYFRSLPSKIGYLLGIPSKKLEAIIYYERYVVINAGAAAEQGVERLQTLSEKEYLDIVGALPKGNQSLDDSDPNKFVAQMGAEAIYTLLQQVDLDSMSYALRHKASTETSQQRKSEALKCLNVIEMFRASEGRNKPEWMVLKLSAKFAVALTPSVLSSTVRLSAASTLAAVMLGPSSFRLNTPALRSRLCVALSPSASVTVARSSKAPAAALSVALSSGLAGLPWWIAASWSSVTSPLAGLIVIVK